MAWRVAKSLEKLRSQVNAQWPKRDKSSDGTIGDERHQASNSDHNPWVKDGSMGVVTGMDITNDPHGAPASNDLAEALIASRDPRIKYVISNARICSGDAGPSPWVWRKYSGANAHRHHVHISVKADKSFYDSIKPWTFTAKAARFVEPIATIHPPPLPTFLQPAANGDPETKGDPELYSVQKRLKAMNYNPGALDGLWGGGTSGALSGFINDRGGHIPVPASLDAFYDVREQIKAELGQAESQHFVRPVSEARKSGDFKTVAAIEPGVVPVRRNFLLTIWTFLTTLFAGIVNALSGYISQAWDFFTDHKDDLPSDPSYLSMAWDYLGKVPAFVWFALAAAGIGFVALNSWRGMKKITESVQTGARL